MTASAVKTLASKAAGAIARAGWRWRVFAGTLPPVLAAPKPAKVAPFYPGANNYESKLDLIGNTTILDSMALVRRYGRVAWPDFWVALLAPVTPFNPLLQLPSGVHFSFFGSFMFGTPEFPVSDVPFQEIVDQVAAGQYQAKPARAFRFDEIQEAHRAMESNKAK